MTFQDFISKFPHAKPATKGNFMVRCPAHEDKAASLSVAAGRNGVVLKCFAGCTVPEIAASLGIQVKDLFYEAPKKDFTPKYKTELPPEEPKADAVIESIYDYTDIFGNLAYQAVRYKPKTFRQRRSDGNGGWRWNMDGVERRLYRLPEVAKASQVWIVEGEKDADNLAKAGFCATTNVGGAGKWLDAYNANLEGKEVVICGDSDKPGQEHVQKVFESVSEKAKSVRLIKLPVGCKDISDFMAGKNGSAKQSVEELLTSAIPHYGGVKMPLYSIADIEPHYKAMVRASKDVQLDLGEWLPTLRGKIRPLVPGEFALFVADTKIGKTAILQNLCYKARRLKTLFFQMELPKELLFERFVAMHGKMKCGLVEKTYEDGEELGRDCLEKSFPNIIICPEARLKPERLEQLILKSELMLGEKPKLVLVDYVQLMKGSGGSRYEQATHVGESMKEIAKVTNTIVVACSQVARPAGHDHSYKPTLHSAKDSGSFESSAGLVIGVSRGGQDDQTLMEMNVLACTKGGAGTQVFCNFDGATMTINERACQSEPN